MMRMLSTQDPSFEAELQRSLQQRSLISPEVHAAVAEIVSSVRTQGDEALLAWAQRFDGYKGDAVPSMRVGPERLANARKEIPAAVDEALAEAAARIEHYHRAQKQALGESWEFSDSVGNRFGQRVKAMQRVGVYAPGGKAFYPSTVLMTAIPARVAGVQEVVLAVPVAGGTPSPVLLAAAAHAGVEEVWLMGGAQAIAALAYGTQSIRPVDKICGPGNVFVTAAKKQVYGDVGIDMLAGPSEVLVIADQTARVDWLIADLMAQAEHDEQAQSILLSEDKLLLEAVSKGLSAAVSNQPRQSIITASLASRGLLIHASSLAEAQRVTNLIAPEHLELAVAQPEEWLEKVQAAGAIFLGHHSPEVVGDYSAGPSHVLPTSGTARFASALGVYDFQLRQSLIQCSAEGVKAVTGAAEILAEEEGLYAHALSAVKRREG